MLKIWKQAWRKGHDSVPPPPRQGSDQEAQLASADSEGTSSPSIDVASPQVDNVSGPVLSAAGRKRALSSQSSTSEASFPSKRSKAIHATAPGQPQLSPDGPRHPSEVVVLYEPPSKLTFTALYKQLREVDQEEKYSHRHFSAALHVLLDMGSCASDLVWRRALSDIDASISLAYNEDEEHAKEYIALFETREIIKNWVYTMPNLDSSSRGLNVTPKFLKLVQILQSCRPHEDSFKGVVFGGHLYLLIHAELLTLLPIFSIAKSAGVQSPW
jgi:endoribonuclease Dicer